MRTSTLLEPPVVAPELAHALPLRSADVSPEEALRKGLIDTTVSERVARTMIWIFMATIFGVPLIQASLDVARGETPQVLQLFSRVPSQTNLRRYEEELERASVAKQFVQPRLQEVVSSTLHFGNPKAVIGQNGWLFYQPGVDYLTGPPLLSDLHLKAHAAKILNEGSVRNDADPRPAILQFHAQCQKAGVHLVLMPIPDKTMLQPAQLTPRLSFNTPKAPINNRDYGRLIAELKAGGVDVFDPTPATISPNETRFLIQDTHWNPEWMQSVAQDLAAHIGKLGLLSPNTATLGFRSETQQVSRVGDLVDMLKLAPTQTAFPPQAVTLRRIVDTASGQPWKSSEDADVLILGDSFCNIFSVEAMGWGDSAGLVEQLSLVLRRPIDRIARNDAGAHATREILSRELAKGKNRLAGKKIIVWEFAMRELSNGEWKLLEMNIPDAAKTAPRAESSAFFKAHADQEIAVHATVVSVSLVPTPGKVPYKDHIFALHLKDLKAANAADKIDGGQAVIYMWSMRDNKLTRAAAIRVGDQIEVKLKPWSAVSAKYEAINRSELNDQELQLEEPNWAEESK